MYVGVHACNLSTWELEPGGEEAEVHPVLHRQFEASLGYMRPWFLLLERKKKRKRKKEILTEVVA